MCERLFERFLEEKPYRNRAFSWQQPAKKGTTGWIAYNVVLTDALSNRVKREAARLEVSLTTVLYTALTWWIELHQSDQYPTS